MNLAPAEPVIVDVPDYLLADNDEARGGRLPFRVDCPACGDQVPRLIGTLGAGQWLIEHQHGRSHDAVWSARRLSPSVPTADRAPDDVAALAAALAPSLAGAR